MCIDVCACVYRDESDLDDIWRRVYRGWKEGNVLATVGTGSLTTLEEKEFGLVGEHNYSIFGKPPNAYNPN